MRRHDNYQGEENDIILLSFVRSNDDADIGFLKISNRINVALSRARKGLYCIGNFDCMAEKSQLWKNLVENLTTQQAIDNKLEIYCQNHSHYKRSVAVNEDFAEVPNGGCTLACECRLPCGHACSKSCHSVDMKHSDIYKHCSKKCDKPLCENQHRCRKVCHADEECRPCMFMVEKVRPNCGHLIKVVCSLEKLFFV